MSFTKAPARQDTRGVWVTAPPSCPHCGYLKDSRLLVRPVVRVAALAAAAAQEVEEVEVVAQEAAVAAQEEVVP